MFAALEPLTDADLGRKTMIRGEAHSVMQAIQRHIGITPAIAGRSFFWPSTSTLKNGSL